MNLPQKMIPSQALLILQEGNARFTIGKREHPTEFLARARETAEQGQRPIATILSCSDSRVPLEIIFDQGIGDLFSIRIVGNVCRESQLGSIEFGISDAGTSLCVILGHTKCGAITAACTGNSVAANLHTLLADIRPAVERAEAVTGKTGEAIIEACCLENIYLQMEVLFRKSAIVREYVRKGELAVVGAVYDIETGAVTFLAPHPRIALLTVEIAE